MTTMRTQADIAERYAAAPLDGGRVERQAWRDLAAVMYTWADIASKQFNVEVVPYDPYVDARAMFVDMVQGKLLISGLNNEHPVWSKQDNAAYRTVHNWCHWNVGSDFTWLGEVLAYRQQARLVRRYHPDLERALYTDTVGQVAYRLHFGEYGPQKVAFIS